MTGKVSSSVVLAFPFSLCLHHCKRTNVFLSDLNCTHHTSVFLIELAVLIRSSIVGTIYVEGSLSVHLLIVMTELCSLTTFLVFSHNEWLGHLNNEWLDDPLLRC